VYNLLHAAVIFRYNLFSFVYLLLLLVYTLLPGPTLKSQRGTVGNQGDGLDSDFCIVQKCACYVMYIVTIYWQKVTRELRELSVYLPVI